MPHSCEDSGSCVRAFSILAWIPELQEAGVSISCSRIILEALEDTQEHVLSPICEGSGDCVRARLVLLYFLEAPETMQHTACSHMTSRGYMRTCSTAVFRKEGLWQLGAASGTLWGPLNRRRKSPEGKWHAALCHRGIVPIS